jgi:hypothetical protein
MEDDVPTRNTTAGLTKAQRAAFKRIVIGMHAFAGADTLRVLLDKGLIEPAGEEIVWRDAFGLVRVPVYGVPIAVHMQWCQWCDENITNAELATAYP